ncbi:hypothetical protein [Kitasatospora fiedleri]|uniref:hypothetical protein n=1 Tax=Kitasatospora fiedleri TaxID=2991545 RepID=UPI00249C9F00|nr:hypothetical protein [Kitasatospora fiedleri]
MDLPLDQCLDTFWHGDFTLHDPPPAPPDPALTALTDLADLDPDLAALLAPLYRRLTG